MISDELISILVCPSTKQKLRVLDEPELGILNNLVERGELKNIEGNVVSAKLENALITEDNEKVYPIRNDIPVLLIEEGISVKGIL